MMSNRSHERLMWRLESCSASYARRSVPTVCRVIEALASLIEPSQYGLLTSGATRRRRSGAANAAPRALPASNVGSARCPGGSGVGSGSASRHARASPTDDIDASAVWYVEDVIVPGIEIDARGYIHLPTTPGAGYRVMRDRIEQYSVAVREFVA